MSYSSFITQVLKHSSAIAKENFGKVKGLTKEGDNNQLLTKTDLEIGDYILSQIRQYFPSHNVLDEEAGVIDNNSEFTWVVDPIDGTSNFANCVPTYGIIIGLLKNASSIAGGIALPEFNRIITAEKGKGAFEEGKKLYVTNEQNLKNVLIAYGIDSNFDKNVTLGEGRIIAEIVSKTRNLRTSNSVFDSVMVAQGSYGAVLNKASKIWDNVGQQIIVEESGGVYTDFFGKPIDYSNTLIKIGENFTFCFGAPQIHKQLQEIIAS